MNMMHSIDPTAAARQAGHAQDAQRQTLLEIRDVSVERHGQTLLKPTSLTLAAGEKLAILGANGAGKSTLLKCIAGDIRDFDGDVRLNRKALQQLAATQRARHIAVMPQHAEMLFPFTVADVVALGRTPFGDEASTRNWQQQAMQMTECWHLRDRRYPDLSGGEQQRTQLARVLVQLWQAREDNSHHHLLLLDECTSALDPAHQHSIMAAVDHFAQSGVGVVAVMHDVALAASWADRILLLKQGETLYLGDSHGLTDTALLERCYDLSEGLARRYASGNRLWLKTREQSQEKSWENMRESAVS